MHELSIALSILEMAEEVAQRQGGRVRAIHLKLGPLSGVVPAALISAFGLAREGSPFPDVELILEETPLVAHCAGCAVPRKLESAQYLCCPVCGAPTPDIVSGRELEVVALEFEP